jgi:hypothetical protein
MPDPGGNLQRLAAAQQSGSGGLIAFAIDRHGAIWANAQKTPGGEWLGWAGPKFHGQPTTATQIAAAGQNNGALMLVMLDEQGMIWTLAQSGPSGGWGEWQGPGLGGQAMAYAAISAGEQGGKLGMQIWATDLDGMVWTLHQLTPGGSWSKWEGPGFWGQLTPFTVTAAAGQNNGNLMFFGLDVNNLVWMVGQRSPGGDWIGLSGPGFGGHSREFYAMAAAEQGGERGVEVWTIDKGGRIWTLHQHQAGAAWSLWEGPGFAGQAKEFSRLAAARQNDGTVMLLAVTRKKSALWTVAQKSPGGDWGDWKQMSGPGDVAAPLKDATKARLVDMVP